MNRRSFWMLALGFCLAAPSFTFAQDRQGGRPDPAQFRERMMNNFKDQMGATAEEWTVIQPKLDKVMTAQFAQYAARMGGGGFRGNRNGGDRNGGGDRTASDRQRGPGSDSAVGKASAELRDAVEKKDTPQEELATKLKALRDAKAKSKADLEAAQKDLQAVLTPRQEAVLVANGMLE